MGKWGCNPTYTLHLDRSSGAFLFLPLSILKEHMPKVKSLKIIFPQSFKIFSQPWNPISFQFIQDILYQVGCTNQVLSPTWGLNNSMPGHHVVWFGSFQVGAFQKNGGWNYICTVFGWESCLLFKAKTFTTPGRFARIYIWNYWFSHANHASSNTKNTLDLSLCGMLVNEWRFKLPSFVGWLCSSPAFWPKKICKGQMWDIIFPKQKLRVWKKITPKSFWKHYLNTISSWHEFGRLFPFHFFPTKNTRPTKSLQDIQWLSWYYFLNRDLILLME